MNTIQLFSRYTQSCIVFQAIKLSDKKEKQGFKRSRNLEKKLQDPEKTPVAPVGFQPFSAAHPDEEKDEREDRVSSLSCIGPALLKEDFMDLQKVLTCVSICILSRLTGV